MYNFMWGMLVVMVWALLGIGLARENEQVAKILLGRPYGIAKSGLYWIPFGIAWVRTYTTRVVELTFAQRDENWKIMVDEKGRRVPAGGFITAPGKSGSGAEERTFGPINMGVSLSFRFNWPKDADELIQCVTLLPNPDDIRALTDLFQEIVMDETRSVGCTMSYIGIMSDRAGFATKISESVNKGESSKLLVETGLQATARVVIDHIDIPQETLDAIDDEEAERLRAQGVRRKAEGERDKLKLEGEGQAAAIAALKAQGQEAVQFESLRTLREMAKGTSNTIFFPLEAIQKLFGNFTRR